MAEKQLIVAVETTGALGPYWNSLLSDYIEKIVRAFGNESTGQRLGGGEFSMVIFNSHANNNCFMWQRTGWTKNVDYYLSWLSGVHFSGGGFNDACIAEGLSETLIMLHDPSKNEGVSGEIKKHVVLVCASNPYPLPTPVYKPDVPVISDNNADPAFQHPALADAETLARYFPHCGISLSVISPKQLPKLRAIYNAARRNLRAADSAVDQVKYGHNLVLLSENFLEARSALNQPINGNTLSNPIVLKSDVGPAAPPVPVGPTGQNQNNIPSVNPSLLNRPMSAANMPPTANIKAEPVTGPGFTHQPNSSLSPISQETNSTILQNNPSNPNNPNNTLIDTTMQDLKPLQMSSSANPVRPVGPAPANVSILNNLSQLRQGGATSMGLPTIGGPTPIAVHMSNMISGTGSGTGLQTNSGIGSFGSAGPGAQSNTGIGFNNNPGSGSNVSGSLGNNAGNLQGMVGQMGQGGSGSTMVMNANTNSNNNQGLTGTGMMNSNNSQSLTGTSMVMNNSSSQGITGTGMVMNNNSNSQGLTGTGMGSVPGSMMSQQQTAGMSAIGMQQHPNAQQSQSKYVKIWEGTLSGQRQGQPVFICKLEGYRSASASDTLAGDWPSTMQIVRLIAQEHMNNKQYVGKADFLVFRTLNQHGFLGQLQEKKLCAVIQLPSQTLLLSVSDKAGRLIGMLFPGDMVVFKPQVSSSSSSQQQQMQLQLPPQIPQQPQMQPQQQQQMQPQQQQMLPQQIQQQQMQAQQQQNQMMGAGMSQSSFMRPQMMPNNNISNNNKPGSMSGGGGFMQ